MLTILLIPINFLKTFSIHFINKIQWDQFLNHLIEKIISLLLLSLLFWIIRKIGRRIINHSFKHYSQKKQSNHPDKRFSTLQTLASNSLQYGLGFFWIYSILSVIGVPIGTLIASAGIVSLAIGLGAQGFVSDIVNGFFILFEKQLNVGEYVEINSIQGTVTAIGLRTTQITSPEGIVNFIPNRNISIISNYSRNNMTVIIQIKIDPNFSIQRSIDIIQQVNQNKAHQTAGVISNPIIKGITTLTNNDPAIQIYIPTTNAAQFKIKRLFSKYYLDALRKANIKLPFNSPTA